MEGTCLESHSERGPNQAQAPLSAVSGRNPGDNSNPSHLCECDPTLLTFPSPSLSNIDLTCGFMVNHLVVNLCFNLPLGHPGCLFIRK